MNNINKLGGKKVLYIILTIIVVLLIALFIQFKIDNNYYYKKLNSYNAKIITTTFGKLSYFDEGTGETLLISHGIFGGYDQGFESLKSIVGDSYHKIAPSRFGYPGSDLPSDPTPQNQAKAFVELLDKLSIQKAYIVSTSAGGSAALSFALEYPERTKGLILISSGVPSIKKTPEEVEGLMGPPKILVNDFPMWLSSKYFGFVFKSMFKSDIDNSVYDTMLPVNPRKDGILVDETITNKDMIINYDDYKIEDIKAPILVVQAKDDPMVKYDDTLKFLSRVNAKTVIFETGGHLITGNGDAVSSAIKDFVEETKKTK